jgi:methylmalonyl-CoA mutase N-terminal domain/subunit
VGVNDFLSEEKVPMKLLQIDPAIEKKLVEQLKKIKRERNKGEANETLTRLRGAAEKENVNLVPFILEAVKEYATLGEVCRTLREVFGEYKPLSIF